MFDAVAVDADQEVVSSWALVLDVLRYAGDVLSALVGNPDLRGPAMKPAEHT
jgi:hypothetical protein